MTHLDAHVPKTRCAFPLLVMNDFRSVILDGRFPFCRLFGLCKGIYAEGITTFDAEPCQGIRRVLLGVCSLLSASLGTIPLTTVKALVHSPQSINWPMALSGPGATFRCSSGAASLSRSSESTEAALRLFAGGSCYMSHNTLRPLPLLLDCLLQRHLVPLQRFLPSLLLLDPVHLRRQRARHELERVR